MAVLRGGEARDLIRARTGVDEHTLQAADQCGLITRLGPQRLDLGAQGDLAVEAGIGQGLAVAGGARREGGVQAMNLVALLGVDLGRLLERLSLLVGRLREARYLAVALEEELLGFGEPVLNLGQAIGYGLLEHTAGVFVLLERGAHLLHRALERADAGVAPVDLDHLLGGRMRRFLDLHFQAVDGERILGAQTILVGANLGRRQRHRLLELVGREARGTAAIERGQQKPDEGRCKEPERHQHCRLDGDHRRIPLDRSRSCCTPLFSAPADRARSAGMVMRVKRRSCPGRLEYPRARGSATS